MDDRPAGDATRLPSLTGLRWVAAVLVFAFHLHVMRAFDGGVGTVAAVLFDGGGAGVSFFFVLSGFVLAWSYRPRRGYARARFARVYPLHLLTAGAALAVLLTAEHGDAPRLPAALANLALGHAWVPDEAYYQSLNTVSWTLSCEAFFYLLLPALAGLTRRLGPRGLWTLGATAAALVYLGPAALAAVAGGDTAAWVFHWTPPGRLPEFVVGVVLAGLVRTGAWPARPGPGVAAAVAAAGCLLAGFVPGPYRYAAVTLPGFVLLIAAAARADRHGRRTAAAHPVAQRLGEWSYAFYLVHLLVLRLAVHTLDDRWLHAGGGVLYACGALAVSVAVSAALYALVETPARRLLTGRGRRAEPVRAPAAATSTSPRAAGAVR